MRNQSVSKPLKESVRKGISALLQNNCDLIQRNIEVGRVCRSLQLVCLTGSLFFGNLLDRAADTAISEQQVDGGWVDVEETMWCAALIKQSSRKRENVNRALKWLKTQQLGDGSWGYSARDKGRIPITGLLIYLLPELATSESLKWLAKQWAIDLQSKPALAYKAAYVLMAFSGCAEQSVGDLMNETIIWLQNEQNEDGGWGPWKNQPVGSTAEYTGVALNGLLSYPEIVREEVVDKAVKWLVDNQLPSGFWPAHYIEEGSAWALLGLTKGLQHLSSVRS